MTSQSYANVSNKPKSNNLVKSISNALRIGKAQIMIAFSSTTPLTTASSPATALTTKPPRRKQKMLADSFFALYNSFEQITQPKKLTSLNQSF